MAENTKPKIDLDSTEPVEFEWPTKIPTPKGEIEITFTFIARTRKELAEMGEARVERARAAWKAAATEEQQKKRKAEEVDSEAGKALDADPFIAAGELVRRVLEETDNDVSAILDIAKGWDLGHPFTAEYLTKLCDRYHAAAVTIGSTYREALSKGRLGNS